MTNLEGPGMWHRVLTALGRGILGRSTHASMSRFTGSDGYWERVNAARLGWPRRQPAGSEGAPRRNGSRA
jgi:hypothetical protein